MQYLDARGADGKTRKYRVMLVDGQIYPLHVAISSHWKIHYFTAEMAHNPEHRAEDAAFLEDMPAVLGPLAMKALRQIQSTLALDYAGIDFGLNAKGEVLLFEANATMVVNPPEPDERWKYRRPAYEQIRNADRTIWSQATPRPAHGRSIDIKETQQSVDISLDTVPEPHSAAAKNQRKKKRRSQSPALSLDCGWRSSRRYCFLSCAGLLCCGRCCGAGLLCCGGRCCGAGLLCCCGRCWGAGLVSGRCWGAGLVSGRC
jgi:hypothetical protein